MSTTFKINYSSLVRQAVIGAFKKLHPRDEIKNLVMFVVWLGSILTTVWLFVDFSSFNLQICLWLWFTCLFANFAEAMAEGRGKAHADELRKMRTKTTARKLVDGREVSVASSELKIGDLIVCTAGDLIARRRRGRRGHRDGRRVGDHRRVRARHPRERRRPQRRHRRHARHQRPDRHPRHGGGGQFLPRPDDLDDRGRAPPADAERDRAQHRAGQPDRALHRRRASCCRRWRIYDEKAANQSGVVLTSLPVLLSLIVCLIPTTIGGLLSAIGIAGIDRLMRRNVLATSGRAVEAAGDVDVLLLDKTGTITLGNRMATEFIPAPGVDLEALADAAQLASLADETPGGPQHRHAGQGKIPAARPRGRRTARDLRAVHGADAHERRRPRTAGASARARPRA